MSKKFLMAAAGMAAMCAATPAFAQVGGTTNTNIVVFLTVAPSCTINGTTFAGATGGVIDFGTITDAANYPTDLDAATNTSGGAPATIVCNTDLANAAFSIDSGRNDSGGFHRLADSTTSAGPLFIKFKLYSGPGRTAAQEYIPGTPQKVNGGAALTAGVPVILNIYGRVTKPEINAAKAITKNGATIGYSDLIQASLTF